MKRFIQFIIILLGVGIGPMLVVITYAVAGSVGIGNLYFMVIPWITLILFLSSGIISGTIFLFVSKSLTDKLFFTIQSIERRAFGIALLGHFFPGVLGLIVGLLISVFTFRAYQ